MAQKHQRSAALFGDMNADAVGFNGTMRRLVHCDSLSGLLLMILHRGELCLQFSAKVGLGSGWLDAFAALARGYSGLGFFECVAQRTRLGQCIAVERFAEIRQFSIVRTTERSSVGGGRGDHDGAWIFQRI